MISLRKRLLNNRPVSGAQTSKEEEYTGGKKKEKQGIDVLRIAKSGLCNKKIQLFLVVATLISLVYPMYWFSLTNSSFTGAAEKESDVGIIEELYQVVTAERLGKIAQNHSQAYTDASPFPHIAIDGIFPKRFLEAVSSEFPESKDEKGCYTKKCFTQAKQNSKSAVDDEREMGMYTRVFFAFLKSSTWITFLEQLSGIQGIIPDPHFRGSGLHMTATGGSLDIHADFNRNRQYNLDRRVNTFVYMNDDWPESYGGHLELWSRDMTSCYQKILPSMGRFVVFSSTDFSYHGHPQPQTSPEDRARKSIALYYYTNGRPVEECLNQNCEGNDHSTLFQKPINCTVCEEATCKRYDETEPYWVETTY